MTYEFSAIRITLDGKRENCIVTINDSNWPSVTMHELIDAAVAKFPDIVSGWRYERKEDYNDNDSLFFTIIHRHSLDVKRDFPALTILQSEMRDAAYRFFPDLFAYMNFEKEK